mmetsp:Transcript_57431/g.91003  ORF Transcript_57431/g.91003 Transcript_57431/m.91003 type:complete len:367 (+) Transcript_57431:416-1516(+)
MLQLCQMFLISHFLLLRSLDTLRELRLLLLRGLQHRLLHHLVHRTGAHGLACHLLTTDRADELLGLKPAVNAGPTEAMRALDSGCMHQPVLAHATGQFAGEFRDFEALRRLTLGFSVPLKLLFQVSDALHLELHLARGKAARGRRLEDKLELRRAAALAEVHHVPAAQCPAIFTNGLAVHRDAVQGLAVMDCPLLLCGAHLPRHQPGVLSRNHLRKARGVHLDIAAGHSAKGQRLLVKVDQRAHFGRRPAVSGKPQESEAQLRRVCCRLCFWAAASVSFRHVLRGTGRLWCRAWSRNRFATASSRRASWRHSFATASSRCASCLWRSRRTFRLHFRGRFGGLASLGRGRRFFHARCSHGETSWANP